MFFTDHPISISIDGVKYYYLYDGLGSVTELIDTGENVVNEYRYDPFGGAEMKIETVYNPHQFTGRQFDDESGMYHYRARAYDADAGRFLQQDPAGMVDGANMYAYCGNDPVNGVDPSGKFNIWQLFNPRDSVLQAERTVNPSDTDMSGFEGSLYEEVLGVGPAYQRCKSNSIWICDQKYREDYFLPPDEDVPREHHDWRGCYRFYLGGCMWSYRMGPLLLGLHRGAPWTWDRFMDI